MIGRSTLRVRQLLTIALVAIALAPAAGGRIDGGAVVRDGARIERAAPGAIVLAQRCFTYKGELKCF